MEDKENNLGIKVDEEHSDKDIKNAINLIQEEKQKE